MAIAVCVFQHEDAIGGIGFELSFVPVHAHGIADEESATVIETAHDGVGDERRSGCDGEVVMDGKIVCDLALWLLGRGIFEGDDHRTIGSRRNLAGAIWWEISGEDRRGGKGDEKESSHAGEST